MAQERNDYGDYLFQRKGSKNWNIRFRYTGELAKRKGRALIDKSLGTPKRDEAEIIALLWGLIGHKGIPGSDKKGTAYFDGQFVVVQIDGNQHNKVQVAQIHNGDEFIPITPFETTDMKGQRLQGNATAQARVAFKHFHDDWPTQTFYD